jgi:ketosteroid isomerase-like protein
MSARKRVVERYIDGFRRTDHAQVLSCLSEDIVWNLHGFKTIQGKDDFDAEIESEGFEGSPELRIERLIEEGDTVVATGGGSVAQTGGKTIEFVFSEEFTFADDLVSQLDTYHVWLQQPERAEE